MRVQRAKQDPGIGSGLRQPETARMPRVVLQPQRELDFRRNMLRAAQLEGEAIEKTAQNEQQRLERLDLLLELHCGGETLRCRDEVKRTRIAAAGALP